MKQIGIAIVGTGWCGGIRAETCAAHALTKSLHIAEIRPERLAEVGKATGAKTAVTDYGALLKMGEIEAAYISATPETTHYPMARDWLAAGKHVFLEKPIAMELAEADELIAPMLSVIPLQLLAYYLGVAKGCDVDKPRNLAKSVTVE